MEFGFYTFGDLPFGTQGAEAARQRIAEVISLARLADEAGLDVIGIGEHHRSDYAISSPQTVLAAIAAVTRGVKLTSAVTILSSSDPVRIFEDFATVDLIANGRAEILIGRGAFIESFPLFGYDLHDYDALFSEILDLLFTIKHHERATWSGTFRSSRHEAEVMPCPIGDLPIWLGAGGTPQSAKRAGALGLPLNLAIIGGDPRAFVSFFDVYRNRAAQAGFRASDLPVAISGHFHLQASSQKARDDYFPHYRRYMKHNLPRRDEGWLPPREAFEALAHNEGSLYVGSPAEIVDKMLWQHELFGHTRFMAQPDIGGLPYALVAESLELLATKVAPEVRKALRPSH